MKKIQLFVYVMVFGSFLGLNTDIQCDEANYVGEIAIINNSPKALYITLPVIGSQKVDSDNMMIRVIGNPQKTFELKKAETFKDRWFFPVHSILMMPVTADNVSKGGSFDFNAIDNSSKSISISKKIDELKQGQSYGGIFVIDGNQKVNQIDAKEFKKYLKPQ